MANNKDFKVKNGIQPTAYHEGLGTVTSGTTVVGTGSVFSENRYDGDGATNQVISTGIDLSVAGSFCWIETNSNGGGGALYYDTGTGVRTFSTEGEAVDTTSPLTLSDGSITVTSYIGQENDSGVENVVWGFKKASKMAEAVEYSGSSSGATVSHNLGQTPGMIMVKSKSAGNAWAIWHGGIHSTSAESSALRLDSTSGEASLGGTWISNVNSSSFTVSNFSRCGGNGIDYVAFVFGNDTDGSGYVKCGSYTGTGNGGPHHVNCGWRPKWILVKSRTTAQHWVISSEALGAGTASEVWEITGNTSYTWQYYGNLTPTDTGFTVSGTSDLTNTSGVEYMFTAIREGSALDTATLDLSTGSVFEITPTSDIQIGLSNPAASGTVSAATLLLDNGVFYDIANASLTNTFGVSGTDSNPQGLAFKADGTSFYVAGNGSNTIYQYDMTTAWDVSTASYSSKSIFVQAQDGTPTGIAFKPDGTRMYYLGMDTDSLYDFTLSTPWDLSTAGSTSNTLSLVHDGTTTNPHAIRFKPDGTKLFVVVQPDDTVDEWTMTTPWDIANATYSQSFSVQLQEDTPNGLAFSGDGTLMFITGQNSDTVYKYNLSTAWDVSTASYSNESVYINADESIPEGIEFGDDGKRMYILGSGGDEVNEYSVGAEFTITYDTSLQWGGGTAPDSPALGETDVLTFATRDGGTTYQAALSIDGAK